MGHANSHQVGGNHYAGQTQHWDYTILALGNRYLEGAITKYVSRHRKKRGAEDLRKALHFLDKLVEAWRNGTVQPMNFPTVAQSNLTDRFIDSAGLTDEEASVMRRCAAWRGIYDLRIIYLKISYLLKTQEDLDRALEAAKAGAAPLGIGTALRIDEQEKRTGWDMGMQLEEYDPVHHGPLRSGSEGAGRNYVRQDDEE